MSLLGLFLLANEVSIRISLDGQNQLVAEVGQVKTVVGQMGQGFQTAGEQVAKTSGALQQHTTAQRDAGQSITSTVGSLFLLHQALQTGEHLLQSVTSALTATVRAGLDFEEAFADVRKTASGTAEDLGSLADQIRRLSEDTPLTVKALSDIASQGGQIGVAAKDLGTFTAAVANLTATTTLSGDAAATFIGQFANLTHMPIAEVDKFSNSLVALANFGASTAQGIQEISLRIAGAGSIIGLTRPQILGWAAAISDAGIEAEAGGSAISRIFEEILKATQRGGAGLQDFASMAGMSTKEFSDTFHNNANAAIIAWLDGVKRIQESGGNLLPMLESLGIADIRQTDAVLRLSQAQNDVASHTDLATRAQEDGALAAEKASERWSTAATHIQELRNALEGETGVAVSPLGKMLGDLAEAAKDTIKNDDALYTGIANDLTPAVKDLGAAVKPLLIDALHELPAVIGGTADVLLGISRAMLSIAQAIHDISGAINSMPQLPDWIAKPYALASNPAGFLLGNTISSFQQAGQHERERLAGIEQYNAGVQAMYDRAASYDQPTSAGPSLEPVYPPPPEGPIYHPPSSAELYAQQLAQAQSRQALGSGAGILTALDKYRTTGLSSDMTPLATDQARLEATIRKELNPAQAESMVRELTQRIDRAFSDATPETRAALESYLGTINHTLTVDRPLEKQGEAEAKRLADQARHAAEQAAQQHADLIAQFVRISDEGASAVAETYGKLGAQVNQALSSAFEPGAGGSQGASLAKSVNDLIKGAKEAGIPEAEAAGQGLKAAVLHAISTKSEADRAAAMALVANLNAEIAAQSALTPENFSTAFGKSQQRNLLGSTGSGLINAMERSAQDGSPDALKQVADAAAAIQREIIGNEALSPESAAAHWNGIWAAINTAIETGGDEARDTLAEKLRQLNFDLPIEAAGERAAEKINRAIDDTAEKIAAAYQHGEEQIAAALSQFNEGITIRGMRQNIKDTQELEIQPLLDGIERARTNLRNYREDEHTLSSRAREDYISERDYLRQIDDIRNKAREHGDGASVGSQARLAEAAAQGYRTGPVNDPLQQANQQIRDMEKQHLLKMGDLKEERSYQDQQTIQRRLEAEADAGREKGWAKQVADFKKIQAGEVTAWEDRLSLDQLNRRIGPEGPIIKERDARIAAYNQALTVLEDGETAIVNRLIARLQLLSGSGGAGPTLPTGAGAAFGGVGSVTGKFGSGGDPSPGSGTTVINVDFSNANLSNADPKAIEAMLLRNANTLRAISGRV